MRYTKPLVLVVAMGAALGAPAFAGTFSDPLTSQSSYWSLATSPTYNPAVFSDTFASSGPTQGLTLAGTGTAVTARTSFVAIDYITIPGEFGSAIGNFSTSVNFSNLKISTATSDGDQALMAIEFADGSAMNLTLDYIDDGAPNVHVYSSINGVQGITPSSETSGSLSVVRTNGSLSMYWNGSASPIYTMTETAPLYSIGLYLGKYEPNNSAYQSEVTFSNFVLSGANVTVPEPGVGLLAIPAAALAGRRFRVRRPASARL